MIIYNEIWWISDSSMSVVIIIKCFLASTDQQILVLMVEQLQIWDTARQERFKAITQSYYRSTNVLILVYDISSTESFDSLNHWLAEIDTYAQNDALVYLVGE